MTVEPLHLLNSVLSDRGTLDERIHAFRLAVGAMDPTDDDFEILADVAYDLEFYSPYAKARAEEPLLIDEAEARRRVLAAIATLQASRAAT